MLLFPKFVVDQVIWIVIKLGIKQFKIHAEYLCMSNWVGSVGTVTSYMLDVV
jgi:hypothetical protein